MKPEKRFYITGSNVQRSYSTSTVYVDGTAADEFREGIDVELSHWMPNRTPDQYKAGTSTEMCFKFLEDKNAAPYDLVINNHIDIDGLLSVFVLAYPSEAIHYREILCDASKTGDFWAWSEGKALKIFQEVTLLYQQLQSQKVRLQDIYVKCFDLILTILYNPEDKSDAQTSLEEQSLLIEQGKIQRHELTPRLVAYAVPPDLSVGNLERFLHTPRFNEPISKRLAFWPQVRNRLDGEKIQLVAIGTEHGTHYDLWHPGYVWADTKGLWRPLGLSLPERAGEFQALHLPELADLIHDFNSLETQGCKWQLFSGLCFLRQDNPRDFPVVATTLASSHHQLSSVPVDKVMSLFRRLFQKE